MRKNTFVEGTLVAYIMILIAKIMGAIYVIPFYKIIGEAGGVLYSYAYNVYALFLNLSTSGIPTAVSILIAEYNAMEWFNEREKAFRVANKMIAVIAAAAFAVMFLFAGVIVKFFNNGIEGGAAGGDIALAIRTISLCLLVIPFTSVLRGYLQGNKYVAVSSVSQVIEQIVRIFVVLAGSFAAIRLLHLPTKVGVAVALTGPVAGGAAAFLYLRLKARQGREELLRGVTGVRYARVSGGEVVRKIVAYAIPVILIAVTENLYNLVDMKLILKGLYMIGYSGADCEYFASVINTWGPKICTIITALAMGLCASVIPFVSEHYVQRDFRALNKKFNQAINTILYVSVPLALFLIVNAGEVFYIFYGASESGAHALRLLAFINIIYSIQLVMCMMLQGMKRYKLIYVSTLVGLILNAALDIPFILLLHKLNLKAYLGTLTASAIGFTVSIIIVFVVMHRTYRFRYRSVRNTLIRAVVTCVIPAAIMVLLRLVFFRNTGYLLTLIELGVSGLLSIGAYLLITYRMGIVDWLFGKDMLDKILTKLHLKR
jgi:O-antigen/teichoic acid export membrane protein